MTALTHSQAEYLRVLFDLGEWEEVVRSARDLLRWGEDHHNPQVEATVLLTQAQVLLYRGRTDEAAAIQERLIGLAREIEDLQVLVPALAVTALVERAQGRTSQAVALIDEIDHLTKEHHGWRARSMPTAVRVLISADEVDAAHELLSEMEAGAARDRHSLLTAKAIVTEATGGLEEARGLYSQAAQRWADYGFVLEHGQAFLGVPPVSTVSGSAQPGEGWQMTADGPRPPPVPVARNPRPGPPNPRLGAPRWHDRRREPESSPENGGSLEGVNHHHGRHLQRLLRQVPRQA